MTPSNPSPVPGPGGVRWRGVLPALGPVYGEGPVTPPGLPQRGGR